MSILFHFFLFIIISGCRGTQAYHILIPNNITNVLVLYIDFGVKIKITFNVAKFQECLRNCIGTVLVIKTQLCP